MSQSPQHNIVEQETTATCSVEMPRYHFDLVDSKTVADEDGQDLPDDVSAMEMAETIAERLRGERPELRNRHFAILVSSQDGEEVGRVPLDTLH